ncbi:DNA-directed RNA polymerase III subunit RPC4-like [Centruroides vittatus]|uniref:DNA-directed RNA polymerase III subunit RPC4-like n=1 Tax=Centruroides vittatus TaxID=120091 RepID=UPI00350F1F20
METNPTNNLNKLPRGLIGRRGLPIARGTRLPSLRGPRDLTLGGAVKRVFAPNIPQRRERSKDNEINSTNKSPVKPTRHRRCRSGEHGRGRGRGKVELIQTQGAVFGDGLAEIPSKSGFNHENSSRDRIGSGKISGSKSKTKREERQDEEEQLQELLRDDFIDYEDDNKEDDGDHLYPVVLPAGSGIGRFQQNFKKKKQWIRIKVESDDESDSDTSEARSKKGASNRSGQEDPSLETAKLFSSTELPKCGKLIFFQFPNCLPGLTDKDEHRNRTETNAESSSSQRKSAHSKKMATTGKCGTLADWPEGYLGKLRIRRSGKTHLDVGSLVLDVEVGTSIEFLQDLASVVVGRTGGALTLLGQVRDKVVCVPGTESLLAACS